MIQLVMKLGHLLRVRFQHCVHVLSLHALEPLNLGIILSFLERAEIM